MSAVSAPVVFLSPGFPFVGSGALHREAVACADLPRILASLASGPSGVALAAIPFDTSRAAWVIQPQAIDLQACAASDPHPASTPAPRSARAVTSQPTRAGYIAAVRLVLERFAAPTAAECQKVVLSRRLTVEFEHTVDVAALIDRLGADSHATTFCLPLEPDAPGRVFVGASPELLIAKDGAAVLSTPLAGSARRSPDAAIDRDRADGLSHSEKDFREHALVVEWIADRLAPYCRALTVPSLPSLVSTDAMWHLGTEIHGTLRDDTTPSAQLALDLHPTPAVCGTPQAWARDSIAELEGFDRRFFGGVVGRTDARGDGRWMVAIRCAEIDGAVAQVYAGAGIVRGSDPAAEVEETSAKFVTLLSALGVGEQTEPRS